MIKIKTAMAGFPAKEANAISIRLMPFQTTATSCSTYFQLFAVNIVDEVETSEVLAEGNVSITEEQYANWGSDNAYIEDIVLSNLKLERL